MTTPEEKARQQIDQRPEQAGRVIQDMKQLNLGAAVGIAVREYPNNSDNLMNEMNLGLVA